MGWPTQPAGAGWVKGRGVTDSKRAYPRGRCPHTPASPLSGELGDLGRGGLLARDHMAQTGVESNQHRGGQQKTAQEAPGRRGHSTHNGGSQVRAGVGDVVHGVRLSLGGRECRSSSGPLGRLLLRYGDRGGWSWARCQGGRAKRAAKASAGWRDLFRSASPRKKSRLTRAEAALDSVPSGSQGEPPGEAGWGAGARGRAESPQGRTRPPLAARVA